MLYFLTKAEKDRFALERKELSEQVRDVENQPEWLRSERMEEIAKLTSEKKALQDRLHDAEKQILQLKTRHSEELEKVVNEKDALAEQIVTREEILLSREDEIIILRHTVGQIGGENREMEERIAGYEERIQFLRGYVEYYRDDIKSLWTELQEERQKKRRKTPGRNVA